MNSRSVRIFNIVYYIFSFLFLVALAIVFFVLEGHVNPPVKGFFCNDKSIRFPYVTTQTIPDWLLFVIIISTPAVVIFCGTVWDVIYLSLIVSKHWNSRITLRDKLRKALNGLQWFVWCMVGLAVTLIISSTLKLVVGELRPHFLAACNPNMTEINCTDQYGLPVYITNYTCLGNESIVHEARLSFPSGHSSSSFYSMVFCALYISSMHFMPPRSPIQYFLVLIFATLFPSCIALTRINDHFHHPHDIIAGAILGIIVAFIVVYYNTWYFDLLKDLLTFDKEKSHEAIIKDISSSTVVAHTQAETAPPVEENMSLEASQV